MSIQKKSLISTLKTAKKANVASAPLAHADAGTAELKVGTSKHLAQSTGKLFAKAAAKTFAKVNAKVYAKHSAKVFGKK
jgi:hypothetical protein